MFLRKIYAVAIKCEKFEMAAVRHLELIFSSAGSWAWNFQEVLPTGNRFSNSVNIEFVVSFAHLASLA